MRALLAPGDEASPREERSEPALAAIDRGASPAAGEQHVGRFSPADEGRDGERHDATDRAGVLRDHVSASEGSP